nr:hypothetical protein [Tanacetum cinerariifolium]
MLVPAQEEELGEVSTMPSAPQHTPIIQPSTSKPQKKQKPKKPRRQDTQETQPSDPTTNVKYETLNEENLPIQSNDPPLLRRVKRLEKKRRSRTHALRRLYNIGLSTRVESFADEQSLEDHGRCDDQEMFDTSFLDDKEEVLLKEAQDVQNVKEEEQGELTINEKSRLFVELMDKRKKHFAKLRPEEKRRKPPTKAQKRNQMCVYLKNMAGFTCSQLKNKSFDEVQKAFDKTMSWINSFVPIDAEVVKDKSELTQESSSKRVDDRDDVTIDATPLSIKTLIIDYRIYKEGKRVTSKILEQMEILRCIILSVRCLRILIEKNWKCCGDWLKIGLRRYSQWMTWIATYYIL